MQSEYLPRVMRSVADDLIVSDPRFAGIVSLMRQAADELEECRNASLPAAPAAAAASSPVFDDDGVPVLGRACPNCED
jgi:hypothetical protein